MTDTVTHVAAPHVTVSGRTLQRCVICGEKLVDSKHTAMPLGPDGGVPAFPAWRAGQYLRVYPGNPRVEANVGHWDDDDLPADLCLPLVE